MNQEIVSSIHLCGASKDPTQKRKKKKVRSISLAGAFDKIFQARELSTH